MIKSDDEDGQLDYNEQGYDDDTAPLATTLAANRAQQKHALGSLNASYLMSFDELEYDCNTIMEEDESHHAEIDGTLWAQSLLRLKRSIDELYSLCEFDSDTLTVSQVRNILGHAHKDFSELQQRLVVQEISVNARDGPTGAARNADLLKSLQNADLGDAVIDMKDKKPGVSVVSNLPS